MLIYCTLFISMANYGFLYMVVQLRLAVLLIGAGLCGLMTPSISGSSMLLAIWDIYNMDALDSI